MPHAPVVAGTFVCYVLYQEELLGAQNIYLHQAELLDGIPPWSIGDLRRFWLSYC
jgi:hypothetical protein